MSITPSRQRLQASRGNRLDRGADALVLPCFLTSVLVTLYVAATVYSGIQGLGWSLPLVGTALLTGLGSSLLNLPLLGLSTRTRPFMWWIAIPLAMLWGLCALLLPALIAGGAAGAFPG